MNRQDEKIKTYVIAPEHGARNLMLSAQLRSCSGFEVVDFPARMLAVAPLGFKEERACAFHNRRLTPGEIGCAMSHRDVWREISFSDREWSLVFEDDAQIHSVEALWELVDDLLGHEFGFPAVVVSLYSESAILREWPGVGVARCWSEPAFALAYLINREAAVRLAHANDDLMFCADWPRASGSEFFLAATGLVSHGDDSNQSLIGDRLEVKEHRPFSVTDSGISVLLNRLSLYLLIHYFRNREHFDGLKHYFETILRHRLLLHLAKILCRGNRVGPGYFVLTFRPKGAISRRVTDFHRH